MFHKGRWVAVWHNQCPVLFFWCDLCVLPDLLFLFGEREERCTKNGVRTEG